MRKIKTSEIIMTVIVCVFAIAGIAITQKLYIAKRISIDGGMCETCHEVPGYIVHHKIELTPDNISDLDIALGFNNLKYDCHICHQKENMKDGPADGLVKYEFDSEGEMVVLPPEK